MPVQGYVKLQADPCQEAVVLLWALEGLAPIAFQGGLLLPIHGQAPARARRLFPRLAGTAQVAGG